MTLYKKPVPKFDAALIDPKRRGAVNFFNRRFKHLILWKLQQLLQKNKEAHLNYTLKIKVGSSGV